MLSHRVQESLHWLDESSPAQPPYPEDVVQMSSAENWLVRPHVLPIIKEAISADFAAEDLCYENHPGGDPALLRAAAAMLNRFFAPRTPVEPAHMVAGAGVAALLDGLLFALADAGDGFLVDSPLWPGFGLAGHLRNGNRLVPVAPPPSAYASREQAARHYAKAMEAAPCRIRGVVVCSPRNPHGHVYPRFWLEGILQFCEAWDVSYISDEIYALSTFGPLPPSPGTPPAEETETERQPVFESPETTFTSVLALDLARLGVDPARVHCIYGLSKDLGSSGLRLGFLTTQQNPALRHALWILTRLRVSAASSLMARALLSDLGRLEAVLASGRTALRTAAAHICDFLARHGDSVAFYRPVAGCFVWARLGGPRATAASDAALHRRLAAAGVALAPGALFGEAEHGWFRITFALPPEELHEGLRRIESVIGGGEKGVRPGGEQGVRGEESLRLRAGKKGLSRIGLALRWITGWWS
ncbi:pyridoxal phosphate-dependent transferase [Xylaria palmicola]|nr:pyridoxal phosphate-dependent transferase [Xylaria palmicola]